LVSHGFAPFCIEIPKTKQVGEQFVARILTVLELVCPITALEHAL